KPPRPKTIRLAESSQCGTPIARVVSLDSDVAVRALSVPCPTRAIGAAPEQPPQSPSERCRHPALRPTRCRCGRDNRWVVEDKRVLAIRGKEHVVRAYEGFGMKRTPGALLR